MTMLAYHNDPTVKDSILAQLVAHAAADEIVKGLYWEDGKGCAVGCAIHSGDHAQYEPTFGIPQMLAHLEDRIFEGLPNDKAKDWPIRFMAAIRPGADLSRVGWKFLHWLLTDKSVNPGIDHPLVKDAVNDCANLIFRLSVGEPVAERAARSAESAAWSAARSAESAARSAARSAESAAWNAARSAESAAWSAESAARSAARSAAWNAARSAESAAWSAAWSAESAAWSAARSAERSAERAARSAARAAWSAARSAESAAWSAESAESAARSAAYVLMSEKLTEFLEAA